MLNILKQMATFLWNRDSQSAFILACSLIEWMSRDDAQYVSTYYYVAWLNWNVEEDTQ